MNTKTDITSNNPYFIAGIIIDDFEQRNRVHPLVTMGHSEAMEYMHQIITTVFEESKNQGYEYPLLALGMFEHESHFGTHRLATPETMGQMYGISAIDSAARMVERETGERYYDDERVRIGKERLEEDGITLPDSGYVQFPDKELAIKYGIAQLERWTDSYTNNPKAFFDNEEAQALPPEYMALISYFHPPGGDYEWDDVVRGSRPEGQRTRKGYLDKVLQLPHKLTTGHEDYSHILKNMYKEAPDDWGIDHETLKTAAATGLANPNSLDYINLKFNLARDVDWFEGIDLTAEITPPAVETRHEIPQFKPTDLEKSKVYQDIHQKLNAEREEYYAETGFYETEDPEEPDVPTYRSLSQVHRELLNDGKHSDRAIREVFQELEQDLERDDFEPIPQAVLDTIDQRLEKLPKPEYKVPLIGSELPDEHWELTGRGLKKYIDQHQKPKTHATTIWDNALVTQDRLPEPELKEEAKEITVPRYVSPNDPRRGFIDVPESPQEQAAKPISPEINKIRQLEQDPGYEGATSEDFRDRDIRRTIEDIDRSRKSLPKPIIDRMDFGPLVASRSRADWVSRDPEPEEEDEVEETFEDIDLTAETTPPAAETRSVDLSEDPGTTEEPNYNLHQTRAIHSKQERVFKPEFVLLDDLIKDSEARNVATRGFMNYVADLLQDFLYDGFLGPKGSELRTKIIDTAVAAPMVFFESATGNWGAFDLDDSDLDPFKYTEPISMFGGEITNMFLMMKTAGAGLYSMKLMPHIGKGLSILEKSGKLGKASSSMLQGSMRGALYSGARELMLPEHMQLPESEIPLTMISFGGSDIVADAVFGIMKAKNFHPGLIQLARFTSDALSSALIDLGITRDTSRLQAHLGPQVIAMGLFSTLSTAHHARMLKSNFQTANAKVSMETSYKNYLDNPTDANLDKFYGEMNKYWETAKPEGELNIKGFLDDTLKWDLTRAFEDTAEFQGLDIVRQTETLRPDRSPSLTKKVPEAKEVPFIKADGSVDTLKFPSEMEARMYEIAKMDSEGTLRDSFRANHLEQLRVELGFKNIEQVERFLAAYKKAIDSEFKDAGKTEIEPINKALSDLSNFRHTQGQKGHEFHSRALADLLVDYTKLLRDDSKSYRDGGPEGEPLTDWQRVQQRLINEFDVSQLENLKLHTIIKPHNGFSINTTKLNSSGAALKQTKIIADYVEKSIDRRTLAAVESEAAAIKKDLQLMTDINEISKVLAQAPEKLTALRTLIADNANILKNHTQTLKTKLDRGVALTELELAQWLFLTDLQRDLIGSWKDLNKNVSMTMNSGRIRVGAADLDITQVGLPEYARSVDSQGKAQEAIKNAGGVKEVIRQIEAFDPKDVAQVNKGIQQMMSARKISAIIGEYYPSNLLLSPFTHLANFVSQLTNMALETPTNFVRAGLNTFIRRDAGMTFGEATQRLVGDVSGFFEAFTRPIVTKKDAGRLMFEKSLSNWDLLYMRFFQPSKYEKISQSTTLASRARAEGIEPRITSNFLRSKDALNTPLRDLMWKALDETAAHHRLLSLGMMEFTDRPFANAGYYSEMYGEIHRLVASGKYNSDQAKQLKDLTLDYRKFTMLERIINGNITKNNLQGKEAETYRTETIKQEMGYDFEAEVLANKSLADTIKSIDQHAMEHMKYMTWKDPIKHNLLRDFEKFLNKHKGAKLFIPFMHTPTRIIEKYLDHTPLHKDFIKEIRGDYGGRIQQETLGRLVTGALLHALGVFLYDQNIIVPPARTPSERQSMLMANLIPGSVRIGDKTIDVMRLGYPGYSLMQFANLARIIEETDWENTDPGEILGLFGESLYVNTQMLLDQSWATSLRELLDAISGVGTENYLEKTLRSASPLRVFDVYSNLSAFGGLNPFYSEHLEEFSWELMQHLPRLDNFGKPIKQYDRVMGLRAGVPSDSPIRQELVDLNESLAKIGRSVSHVELTDDLYYKMQKALDEKFNAEDQMNRLVTSRAYQRAPREEKIRRIDSAWKQILNQARRYIQTYPEYRELHKEYVEERRDLERETNYIYRFFELEREARDQRKPSTPDRETDDLDWLRDIVAF